MKKLKLYISGSVTSFRYNFSVLEPTKMEEVVTTLGYKKVCFYWETYGKMYIQKNVRF